MEKKPLSEIVECLDLMLKNITRIKEHKEVRHYVGLNYQVHLGMLRSYAGNTEVQGDMEQIVERYEQQWISKTGHDLYTDAPRVNGVSVQLEMFPREQLKKK